MRGVPDIRSASSRTLCRQKALYILGRRRSRRRNDWIGIVVVVRFEFGVARKEKTLWVRNSSAAVVDVWLRLRSCVYIYAFVIRTNVIICRTGRFVRTRFVINYI